MPKYNAGVSFITENDGMNCFMTFILHFFYSRSLLVGRLGVGGANHRLLPNSSRVTTERFGRSRCNVSHPLAQPAGCLHRGILCTTLCKKRTCQVKKKNRTTAWRQRRSNGAKRISSSSRFGRYAFRPNWIIT